MRNVIRRVVPHLGVVYTMIIVGVSFRLLQLVIVKSITWENYNESVLVWLVGFLLSGLILKIGLTEILFNSYPPVKHSQVVPPKWYRESD